MFTLQVHQTTAVLCVCVCMCVSVCVCVKPWRGCHMYVYEEDILVDPVEFCTSFKTCECVLLSVCVCMCVGETELCVIPAQ